jgi:hypothetical protein
MQRIAMFLAILGVGTVAALTSGCKNPPTQSEMTAYEYGPRPENYEKLIRDYLWPKLLDPGSAIVEFKAGPKQLFQQETALRPLRHARRLRRPLPDGVLHTRREDRRGERRAGRQHHRLALRAHRVQRARRSVLDALIEPSA